MALVAYPDEVLGERACAVVVPRPEADVTLEEIVAYLKEEGIATFKLPERLEIRDELPRNPLGKILKRELNGTNCDNKEFAASACVRYPLRIRLSRSLIGNSRR